MTKPKQDAAAADVGVEARHVAARRMAAAYPGKANLYSLVSDALASCTGACMDDAGDRGQAVNAVLLVLQDCDDARFLRELLGPDPGDRITRLHAHGSLMQRATDAAWRLAGGTDR